MSRGTDPAVHVRSRWRACVCVEPATASPPPSPGLPSSADAAACSSLAAATNGYEGVVGAPTDDLPEGYAAAWDEYRSSAADDDADAAAASSSSYSDAVPAPASLDALSLDCDADPAACAGLAAATNSYEGEDAFGADPRGVAEARAYFDAAAAAAAATPLDALALDCDADPAGCELARQRSNAYEGDGALPPPLPLSAAPADAVAGAAPPAAAADDLEARLLASIAERRAAQAWFAERERSAASALPDGPPDAAAGREARRALHHDSSDQPRDGAPRLAAALATGLAGVAALVAAARPPRGPTSAQLAGAAGTAGEGELGAVIAATADASAAVDAAPPATGGKRRADRTPRKQAMRDVDAAPSRAADSPSRPSRRAA